MNIKKLLKNINLSDEQRIVEVTQIKLSGDIAHSLLWRNTSDKTAYYVKFATKITLDDGDLDMFCDAWYDKNGNLLFTDFDNSGEVEIERSAFDLLLWRRCDPVSMRRVILDAQNDVYEGGFQSYHVPINMDANFDDLDDRCKVDYLGDILSRAFEIEPEFIIVDSLRLAA